MALVPSADVLLPARQAGRGVGAFNVIQLEHAEALVAGAERAGSPVILQISQNAARYHGSLEPIGLATLAVARHADVPVVVPVPAFRFDDWIAYIEGMCVKLPCDGAALEAWWSGLAQRDRTRHLQHNACEVLK